ncbi:MAG: DUF2779 domain-containing protein [Eggerthellaceae bacterium]
MYLSKSRYCRGVQCPKMLWMESHKPELFDDSVLNQAILQTGNEVGDLAMGYFGPFIEVPFREHGKSRMLEDTWRFLQDARAGRGPVNIAEASFDFNGNFCSVDILRVEGDGVHIVEVKSSTHLNDIYLHDMAYQTWVLQQWGLKVLSTSLMHVNPQYVRNGDFDLHQYFVVEDYTDEVAAMLPEIADRVEHLKAVADQEAEPVCAIGCQCSKPYACGYRQWCWREVPQPSVFDLNRMSTKKAVGLYEEGVRTFSDLQECGVKLNARQQVQVETELSCKDLSVNKDAAQSFLQGLTFPLYFLDFETFQPAIPPFDGVRPYQQIPTQYSLHVLESPDGPLTHKEFLAKAGEDPRRAVAEHLVVDIPAGVCTLAYNMSFEKGRIAELAKAFPDLADQLLAINEGVDDLMKPFAAGDVYVRAMGGSNSIKAVLPALFPHDPDLDYHALEGVHNGSEAMAVYAQLADMAPEQAEQVRQQLFSYCELDTLAMVKIYQFLIEVAR